MAEVWMLPKFEQAAEVWQPKVAKVNLFHVAEAQTYIFDYTLPFFKRNQAQL